jgi:hypothetical protein
VPELDLEGRSCPCVDGYTCVADVCVRDGADAGALDARLDAPTADAPAVDAPGVDAPGVDAAGTDAGPVDSGVDAGPPDAGPADGGPDAPAVRDTGCDTLLLDENVVFCDGFEDDLSAWTMTGGIVEQVRTGTYRGTGAVEMAPLDGVQFATLSADVFDDPDERDHWLRAYIRVEFTDVAHALEIMALAGPSMSFPVYVEGSGFANIHGHGFGADAGWDSSEAFPLEEWVCVEIHARYAGGVGDPGRAELFINGVDAARGDDIEFMARANAIQVGSVFADPETGRTQRIMVDEVVASLDRIGCD